MNKFDIRDTDINYKYPNFYTDYKYSINNSEMVATRNHSCYAELLYKLSKGVSAHLKAELYFNHGIKNGINSCLLEEKEIEEYLSLLSSIFEFSYTFSFKMNSKCTIYLEVDGDKNKIGVMLMYIRFLFEWNMTFILREAFNIRENEYFKDIDILNLYYIGQNSHFTQNCNHTPYRSTENGKIIPYHDINWHKERINYKINCLNDFLPLVNVPFDNLINFRHIDQEKFINSIINKDLSNIEHYKEVYNIMLKYKENGKEMEN